MLINVKDLRTYLYTRRGVVKAVDGVSFYLRKGETLGIVGESGCGKSITALSLLRLVPEPAGRIVGGQILFKGRDLLQMSHKEMRRIRGAELSMILQDPLTSLNPAYSIGNQIGEAIRLHQKNVTKKTLVEKIIEALKMVRIPAAESRLGDYPHQMSGGMRQRVTGAIALSCQPSLLIADEPTTSLDVTIQAQYLRLLKDLQRETGVSLIFITHDFGIVAAMCDRVQVMYAGKIVESAKTRDIFDRPRHPYARALMGCLPKIEKRLESLTTIEGQPPQLIDLPGGCSFAPRCPEAEQVCFEKYPEEAKVNEEHRVNCWHG